MMWIDNKVLQIYNKVQKNKYVRSNAKWKRNYTRK